MIKKNKEELEEKLIEELEDDYDENKSNKKLLVIGLSVTVVLIIVAVVLSLMAGKKTDNQVGTDSAGNQPEGTINEEAASENKIQYDDRFSRAEETEVSQKAGEPTNQYPPKTSGSRVAVDESGKNIEDGPIQKSLIIENSENPFYALNTIAPEIYNLMEINFYSSQNKSITLAEFAERSRMDLPQELFTKLDSFYRVFMYRAEGEKGPGTVLVFSTGLEKAKVDEAMRSWEKAMTNNLKPFVLIGIKKDLVQASGKTEFQSSSIYSGGRYVDFSGDGIVSLNYLVEGKYIIIGNSQTSFDKVVSLLKKQ